jgi:hypothetical protein
MYLKKLIFGFCLLLLSTIATLNYLAFQYFWYWRIWWFDLTMHFLGGILVGLFFLWYFFVFIRTEDVNISFKLALKVSIIGVLIIGLAWELFEFGIDQYWAAEIGVKSFGVLQQGWMDTLSDLTLDLIGGFGATYFFWQMSVKSKIDSLSKSNHG